MAHPYSVREIARQAGVSDATVDRVLHNRPSNDFFRGEEERMPAFGASGD